MNRGSEVKSELNLDYRATSMRPRFMNRGSAKVCMVPVTARSDFNEAPIHESGKYQIAVLPVALMDPLQ